jgi:pimeloyl-ACP methyl ester carboxylesterase
MAKLEPKGTMIIVENCGHIVNIEQAEEFNGISLNWLRNLPL